MCGIAGILTSASPVSPDRLKKMTDAIAHRGPDGEGHWIHPTGKIGLGHRRLAIIDRSDAGRQPMHCLDRYTLIHNGEIYNYLELRTTLEKKGYRFHTQTDTEVIASAYDHWGKDCLTHFNGMFAFAIWDEKEQELFAARDRFGEKPFFFTQTPEGLFFGSEIKTFWAAGLEKKVNHRLLFNYLSIGYVDNPTRPRETFFEGIHKLPAAHCLSYRFGDHEPQIESWWELDLDAETSTRSAEEVKEQFLEKLTRSVQWRLRSDVPVGTSLSGGLDSSSILALIAGTGQKEKRHSFSAVFPGFDRNEEVFMEEITQRYQWPLTKVRIDDTEIAGLIQKVCTHLDEPFGSASNIAQYQVYRAARQHGTPVLLDGQGADEILAGYGKYFKWYWQELFRKRKLLRSGELKAARQLGNTESFGFSNIVAALVPDLASVLLEQRYLLKAVKDPGLSPEFIHAQGRHAYLGKPAITSLNEALYYNTVVHGLDELLRYADRNSMAHGVEVRLPFLDHELVEFLFSLPADFKIRNGYTKYLLRETMQDRLPASIAWRADKVGFEPPQKMWMRESSVQEMIHHAKVKLVEAGFLRDEVLNRKPQAHSAYAPGAYDWRYLTAGYLI